MDCRRTDRQTGAHLDRSVRPSTDRQTGGRAGGGRADRQSRRTDGRVADRRWAGRRGRWTGPADGAGGRTDGRAGRRRSGGSAGVHYGPSFLGGIPRGRIYALWRLAAALWRLAAAPHPAPIGRPFITVICPFPPSPPCAAQVGAGTP